MNKNIIILIVLSFVFVSCYAISNSFNKNKEKGVIAQVKNKLSTDTIAFGEFMILANCSCMDKIDSTMLYNTVFDEMNDLWLPIPRLLGNNEEKIRLASYFIESLDSNIESVQKNMRYRDEYVRSHNHSIIICDRVFSNDQFNWQLYRTYIFSDSTLNGLPHHLEEYLDDSSVVINHNGW